MKAVRYQFDGLLPSARVLLLVLTDARKTEHKYRVSGLTAQTILNAGLRLSGDFAHLTKDIEKVPGVVRYDD